MKPFTLSCIAALCLLVVVAPSISFGEEPADVVLLGGKIVTLWDARPVVSAIAVRGDRIAAVGSDEEIQPLIGDHTRVIQLAGKFAMPSFIEGHGHFLELGESKKQLDLSHAKTWEEVVALTKKAAEQTQPGRWIIGWGWHQDKWSRRPEPNYEGFPSHQKLSAVTPNNPVLFMHASGHMCLVNAKTMELAGVDGQTKDPAGGEILRDPDGNAIGVFLETAGGIVKRPWERERGQAHTRAENGRPR